MDSIQNLNFNLELIKHQLEEKELLVCRKCQEIKLQALRKHKQIYNHINGSNLIAIFNNVCKPEIRPNSDKNCNEVTENLKYGCVIIFKKLSRLHTDALITVSQKEILLQITFTQNCTITKISLSSIASATLHIHVFKTRNKIEFFNVCAHKKSRQIFNTQIVYF